MTDINAIMTQQAKTGLTNLAAAGAQSDKAGGTGVSFFDMIFARLTAENNGFADGLTQATAITQNSQTAEKPDAANLAANPLLTLLNLNHPQITIVTGDSGDSNALTVESQVAISPDALDLTATGATTLQSTLDTLLQGLPADHKPVLVNMNTAQLKKALEKLSIDLQSSADGNASLIATGLTPQDLTALIDQLDHVQNQGENTLMVGMMQMVQTGTELQAAFIPRAIIDGKIQTPAANGEPTDDLATALNALNVGGSADADAADTVIDTPAESAVKSRRGDLGEFLKLLEQFQGKTADTAASAGAATLKADGTAAAAAAQTAPATPATGSSFHGMLGSLSASVGGLSAAFPDGADWSGSTADTLANTTVTSPAQLANLVTGVKQAGQPHPTTQIIAATLTRGVQSGENKTMTLQLDPPELGRVEIQMHFTKDKSVKAHMVFEKPETMLMMQRDAQVLERALLDAGMDAGGNDLSFELASQDHMFGDDRGNGRNSGGNGGEQRASGGETEIIETTMLWHVDPDTGMQRYNIIA